MTPDNSIAVYVNHFVNKTIVINITKTNFIKLK